MAALVTPAIAEVKANRVADAYAPLAEVVNRLAARGAAAVVLGCTEIPLGIQAGPQETLRVPRDRHDRRAGARGDRLGARRVGGHPVGRKGHVPDLIRRKRIPPW